MNISEQVLSRIVSLASQGYDVRFLSDYNNWIKIRLSKSCYIVEHVVSIEELEKSRFDIVLYIIDRLMESLNEYGV